MFSVFFQKLLSLGNETRLLEACEWDEEKVLLIKEKFSESVENSFSNNPKDKSDVIEKIKLEMSAYATSNQIDILIEILEDSIKNSLNGSIEAEYEN